jgi:hypothetical protein
VQNTNVISGRPVCLRICCHLLRCPLQFTVRESIEDEARKRYAFYWKLLQQQQQQQQLGGTSNGAAGSAAAASSSSSSYSVAFTAADIAHWKAVLNQQLCQHSKVYAPLLSAGQISPAAISLVAPGAFAALKEAAVAAKGIRPSQFKMPTVVASGSRQVQHLEGRRVAVD